MVWTKVHLFDAVGFLRILQNFFCLFLLLTGGKCSVLLSANIKTLQTATCETEELMIKCPAKTSIYIQFANYGRLVSSRERPCHNVVQTGHRSNVSIFHSPYDIEEESRNCVASGSREKVIELCQDKKVCRILVNAETFKEDPCPKTWKYLEVAYKCKPNVFHNQVVCEGEPLTLECENPTHRLAIHSAMFGRDRSGGSALCPGPDRPSESGTSNDCMSSFATEMAMTRCQNERLCTLQADEATFGNQCPSGVRKYLTISYACVPQRILISPSSRNKDPARMEDKTDDYTSGDRETDDGTVSSQPSHSIAMQADLPSGSSRNSKNVPSGHQSHELQEVAMVRCNCTGTINVFMDWMVAYHRIAQNKESCILYACLAAGIGMLLLMLLLLIHLLLQRRSKAHSASHSYVLPQSNSRTMNSKASKEQRTPLYNTHFPDESDEVAALQPVDITRYAPRSTLPRAVSLSTDIRKPMESRSMHRLTTDGSFYS